MLRRSVKEEEDEEEELTAIEVGGDKDGGDRDHEKAEMAFLRSLIGARFGPQYR